MSNNVAGKTKPPATEQALTPKLRFPEFRDAREWEEHHLAEIACKFVDGDWIESKDQSVQGVRLIQTGNIGVGEFIPRSENARYISEDTFERLRCTEVFPGDCLISRLPDPAGRSCLIPNIGTKMITAVDCTIVQFDERKILPYLFVLFSQSEQYFSEVTAQCSGSTRQRISRENLSRIKVPLPSLTEQQKIADCLSSLDELITAEAQKLDTLRAYKKGLMQQLFPSAGETLPKLRFANEGDWTVVSLPEVVFFQEGPGIMAVDFRSEGVPLVRLAGVGGTAVTLDGCNYLDPEKVAQKWAHFRLAVNDLLISTSATFGLSSIVTHAAAGAVFYTGLIRFQPSNERLNLGYLKAFLGSPHFARQAESAAVGGGIKHFGPTHLKQMEIPIPTLAEQQGIADCLSSLDELITAQTKKLDALKVHKKGLMQQLFPALYEVNG